MSVLVPGLSRILAATLTLTAALKVVQLLRMPIAHVPPDPVVAFMTSRETLLLAAGLEVGIAYHLLNSPCRRTAALLLLYFSACASLYQMGLVAQGDLPCTCLGVATEWLGRGRTAAVTRALLLGFWASGLVLLHYARKAVAVPSRSAGGAAGLSAAAFLLLVASDSVAATVEVRGEYWWSMQGKGKLYEKTNEFQARFDETALQIISTEPTEGPRSTRGPLTNVLFVTKDVLAGVGRVAGVDLACVALKDPKYAWELGTCGAAVDTTLFVTLRCMELFPPAPGRGVRRIAPTWSPVGEFLNLVTEGHYSYSGPPDATVLTCDVAVSEALRRSWPTSLLLPASLSTDAELSRGASRLAAYKAGFLCETLSFSAFTNIGGLRFPTHTESQVFAPAETNLAGKVVRAAGPYGKTSLDITAVSYPSAGPLGILPVRAASVQVSEGRLADRRAHVDGADYQTNELRGFEISPVARVGLEREVLKARALARAKRVQKVFSTALVLVAIMGPALYYLFRRRQGVGLVRATDAVHQ